MRPKTILLVDDEETVRTYVKALLRNDGFEILEASDGLEALESIKQLRGSIDLLLTDVRMPRMDGLALAHAVTDMFPEIPVLFISGYSLDIDAEKSRHPTKNCGFVQKPFFPKVLLDAVRKCLDSPKQVSGTTA